MTQKVLDQMNQEIQEMLRRSEVLGEQGDIDGSQAAATQAEAIKVGLINLRFDSLRILSSLGLSRVNQIHSLAGQTGCS